MKVAACASFGVLLFLLVVLSGAVTTGGCFLVVLFAVTLSSFNERHLRLLVIVAASPSIVGAAISFALLQISSVVGLIALSHCSSIQPISSASLILGFTPLLMTMNSPLLEQQLIRPTTGGFLGLVALLKRLVSRS